jgi:hypothetical protein
MRHAKSIQLDVSYTLVFEYPTNSQEWIISETFSFADSDPENWSKKPKFALQSR